MAIIDRSLTTGLTALDRVVRGLIPGDNIVWRVDTLESYKFFVEPFYKSAVQSGRTVVYFHFTRHEQLIQEGQGVEIHEFDPEIGFEDFISGIHSVIEAAGRGAFYVFDCLSDLATEWYSDGMLANFFMLTCPYLYDLETIAYFALLKDHHSTHATDPIERTTQLLLDLYRHNGTIYLHPLKVQQRHSSTMYMIHAWDGTAFNPVTESYTIAELMSDLPWTGLEASQARLGVWQRIFQTAEQAHQDILQGKQNPDTAQELFERIVRMVISHEPRVLDLARRYFVLRDLLQIYSRMIGTGLIGGKSVGMLLARAILKKQDPKWERLLEPHDSFFIGSDVFYTYLVRNNSWWVHQRQRKAESFLVDAEKARLRILRGNFPSHITRQFEDMLDYFGQSPIIVRSSSLLEDNFGNAFAGKYESVFCPNQGSREQRLQDFLAAVRTIYASTLSEKALSYRLQRGILDRDEQMALLVQRVSGDLHHGLFYPQIAGVGFSFNPYAWNENIDPEAGMLRLVFGLGTRAVDRSDDDYTRLVSLSDPHTRPEANINEARQFAQRRVDVLDLDANQLLGMDFEEVAKESPKIPLSLFASRDTRAERRAREAGMRDIFPWVLTFDKLFSETDFVANMKEMLACIQKAYDYPVDIEYTANFIKDGVYRINLVQCRPLQIRGGGTIPPAPADIATEDRVLEAHGAVIGQSRYNIVDRVIYIPPSVYGHLPLSERYSVARLIGQIMRLEEEDKPETVMLIGPGRWGTTTPSLGVPVSFSEISRVSAICEIVAMRDDLIPDVSLGTHFFSDLVEMEILYLALFPKKESNQINDTLLKEAPNRLLELLPEAQEFAGAIRVIDFRNLSDGKNLWLHANTIEQQVLCYLDDRKPTGQTRTASEKTDPGSTNGLLYSISRK